MQTARRRPEWAGEVGRAAAKRVKRTSKKPGGGARRGAGRRGGLLGALGRAARRGSAPLKPAASGRERRRRCGAQEGCGARAGSIVVLPSPSRALPQHHSQDNSTTRRCPRTSPAWAGGAREKGADQAPQPNLGCSRAAWRLRDPDGGRGVSVRLRIDPSWHQGRCRGRRDAAGAEGGTAAGAAELPAGELVTRGGRRPREQREGGLENVKKAADCAGWTQGDGRGGVWAEINHERLEPPQTVAGESGALRCPGTER